ncbi:hypothetical protein M2281_002473 [Mesorhizobium soli]|nr:hypothetical protein [Mesorhizobium soli]
MSAASNDRGSDFIGHGPEWFGTAANQHDVAPFGTYAACYRRADARSTARDQGGSVLETHNVSSPFRGDIMAEAGEAVMPATAFRFD